MNILKFGTLLLLIINCTYAAHPVPTHNKRTGVHGQSWQLHESMSFAQGDSSPVATADGDQPLRLIELRNYLIRPRGREEFIKYFEENFIQSQNNLGGYILGMNRVKGADDNFFWIRGFADMGSRKKFLEDFYYGSFWKQHKLVPNSLLLNNDNVYLLKPLNISSKAASGDTTYSRKWFEKKKGITVVNFFISNTKLDKLITFVKDQYAAILGNAGVDHTSFWVSETTPNDFPRLPVFQDKNLLVQISFYKDEAEYQTKMTRVASKMTSEQKTDMADLVTLKNTLIVYPTAKSFSSAGK